MVFDGVLELEGLDTPCADAVLVALALEKIDVVLVFPFPFCVGVMLAGVVMIDVSKVDFTVVDVYTACEFYFLETRPEKGMVTQGGPEKRYLL